MFPVKPERTPWRADFPAVVIHANQSAVKQHVRYGAAKGGWVEAAFDLVMDTMCPGAIDMLRAAIGGVPAIVVGVQAIEGVSTNVIPEVMARVLARMLELPIDDELVQINRVGHTGSSGWHRLAHPALFSTAPSRPAPATSWWTTLSGRVARLPTCEVTSSGQAARWWPPRH